MKKALDILQKLLSPSLFAMFYLPYLALNMITIVNVQSFTRYFLAFFAMWGFAVCVNTYFFGGKKAYTDKYMLILIAFFALCGISMVINYKYGGTGPIGKLAFFALCILVLYSQFKSGMDDYKKTLLISTRAMSVVITLAMLLSLVMFFNLYTGKITGRAGADMYLGVAQNRLYGVFSSANVGGMYALILIWCAIVSLYNLKKTKLHVAIATVNVIQIVISLAYISLSLSRGTYLSGIVMLVTFMAFRKPFKKELTLKLWKQAVIRFVSTLLVTLLVVSSIPVIHDACCKISELVVASEKEEKEEKEETEETDKKTDTNKKPNKKTDKDKVLDKLYSGHEGRVEKDKSDITNKRKDIWLTHLSLMKGKNLLFGVNEPLIYYNTNLANGVKFTHNDKIYIEWASGNMHNGYLQILVHCGIFALAAMLAFLVLSFVKTITFTSKTVRGKIAPDSDLYKLFSLCIPMVTAILSNNIVETNFVLMGANFFQAVFWFAAGALVFCFKSMHEEK
ncbi:MAG: O-antigen ligase family protein [Clostridia bacterium]|nr:O-antigen ligase family protein [Clostridia bacterium]